MKWDIQTVGFKAKDELMDTTKEQVMSLKSTIIQLLEQRFTYV